MPIKDHDASYRTVHGVAFACIADRNTNIAGEMVEQIRAWGYRARLARMHDSSDLRRVFVPQAQLNEICARLDAAHRLANAGAASSDRQDGPISNPIADSTDEGTNHGLI